GPQALRTKGGLRSRALPIPDKSMPVVTPAGVRMPKSRRSRFTSGSGMSANPLSSCDGRAWVRMAAGSMVLRMDKTYGNNRTLVQESAIVKRGNAQGGPSWTVEDIRQNRRFHRDGKEISHLSEAVSDR